MIEGDPQDFLTVGRIGRPHGIRGESRVDVLTDFPELRFARGAELLLGPPGKAPHRRARVVSTRKHLTALLVRFQGVATREAASELTGMEAFVPRQDAAPLPDGSYYIHDLIGLEVVGPDESPIGKVTSFIETGAADVVVVTTAEGREHLIPLTEQIVKKVEPDRGRMLIQPLPGLLD